jgi:hypothetical protein
MIGLGELAGGSFLSVALDVSSDGSLVIRNGTSNSGSEPSIWDAPSGMRAFDDVLTALGRDITGWTLAEANALSGDGLTIVGRGIHPSGVAEGWIATIPEPSTALLGASGLVFLASSWRGAESHVEPNSARASPSARVRARASPVPNDSRRCERRAARGARRAIAISASRDSSISDRNSASESTHCTHELEPGALDRDAHRPTPGSDHRSIRGDLSGRANGTRALFQRNFPRNPIRPRRWTTALHGR